MRPDLTFPGDAGPITVTVCTPRILRVAIGGDLPPDLSYVGPRDWPVTSYDVAGREPLRVATSDLRVDVQTRPRRLTFSRRASPTPGSSDIRTSRGSRAARPRI